MLMTAWSPLRASRAANQCEKPHFPMEAVPTCVSHARAGEPEVREDFWPSPFPLSP
ncbi:protein of unknown function [Streptomyces murinus]